MTFEQIKKYFDIYQNFCTEHLSEENKEPFKNLINDFGERLILCPASTNDSYHSAIPGGLLKHSINVFNIKHKLFDKQKQNFGHELKSNVTICLLHDIGKLGTKDEEYYIETASKNSNYYINDKLKNLSISNHTVKLLLDYKFNLTDNEYIAILNAYFFIDKQETYSNIFKLPTIAHELAISKLMAINNEKK